MENENFAVGSDVRSRSCRFFGIELLKINLIGRNVSLFENSKNSAKSLHPIDVPPLPHRPTPRPLLLSPKFTGTTRGPKCPIIVLYELTAPRPPPPSSPLTNLPKKDNRASILYSTLQPELEVTARAVTTRRPFYCARINFVQTAAIRRKKDSEKNIWHLGLK